MKYLLRVFLCVFTVSCATQKPRAVDIHEPPGSFSMRGDVVAPDAWWEAFGDEALNDFMRQALADNFSLRSAWDRLAQAEAIAVRQGADLFPEVNGLASATRTRRENDDGRTIYRNEFSAGLVASYELDVWGRVRSAREASALDAAASAEQVQSAAITLAAEIATVWMQRIEQSAQVELLQRQLETNDRILAVLNQRFRSGQSGAVDVLQQEQLVEARRGDLASAKARLTVLENQLAVLGGRPAGTELPAVSALPGLPPVPVVGVPADVIARRPDMRRAYHRIAASDQRVAAAVADRFPRVSITARTSSTEENIDDLFSNWISSLAANLIGPIIDGGSRRAEVSRTRAALSEAINDYRQTLLVSLAEVENSLAREARQRELLDSLRRQLELATQVSGRLRDRYLGGNEDFIRVLTADLSQQALERNVISADRELLEIRIGLYRAISGQLPVERPEPATLKARSIEQRDGNPANEEI
ncbi:MAG TPA: efflux transporter outer membrane subunit [Kiritimatiellia bacterium]|nr:efflux transporter outer membrane subunit [Kiritimatiellia bacterium]